MKINRNTIEKILRDNIERRGLCDHEIAQMLNVGTTTVNCWRNRFSIRPAEKFHRRFREKYGEVAEQQFRELVEQGVSLQEIGRRFGFSREYARQVHRKLYGMSYREFTKSRQAEGKPARVKGEKQTARQTVRPVRGERREPVVA